MEKEASLEKMILAEETCLNILQSQNIAILRLREFVVNILDAIDLVGEDCPFTKPQEEELVKKIKHRLLVLKK